MKFGMETHHGGLLRVIEAIFDTSPLSRDMGVGLDCPWGSKIMKIFFSIFLFFHFHWLDLVQARPEYTKLSHNSYPMGNNWV